MQESLFRQSPAGLVPNIPVVDPLAHQKSRINATKAEHYEAHITSEKGKRQVDLVFDALASHPDSTDRELKAIIEGWGHPIEISAIPARRADIDKFFSGWRVVSDHKKVCTIMKTYKQAWRLKRTPSGQLQ
jgi:hypothetical protein